MIFIPIFREITSCFRHLETTPFCPADIFPREGATSYRRMGIIAIIVSAPASPLPLHGERVGERGLFSVFLEGESKFFQTQRRKAAEFFLLCVLVEGCKPVT